MSKPRPMARLRDILNKSEELVDIIPENRYKQVTVQLWGKGVTLRNEVRGSEIAAKRRMIVHSQQFILSRIDARNGAFGIVPNSLEEGVVSNDFPVFNLNLPKVIPGYLGWMCKTREFIDICKAASEGTTNRVRLKVDEFLESEVPLPEINEQRRIVARIEVLAARIEEARELRRRAVDEAVSFAQILLDRVYTSSTSRFGVHSLAKTCTDITDGDHLTPSFTDSGVKFIFVGNVSSGFLHFKGCKYVDPEYFAAIKSHRIPRRGDILFSAVGATLGIPAIVDTDESFCFQRHVALIRPNPKMIICKFLWYMLRSKTLFCRTWSETTGSAQPTVPLRAIRALQIPIPSIEEQHKIIVHLDTLQSRLDALKRHQAETAAALDALLPAVLERAFRGEI